MELDVGRGKKVFLLLASLTLGAGQLANCSGSDSGPAGSAGSSNAGGGGDAGLGGEEASAGVAGLDAGAAGSIDQAGAAGTDGAAGRGEQAGAASAIGGAADGGFGGEAPGGGSSGAEGPLVAITRAIEAQASQISEDEVRQLVTDAVTQAGGLDFIGEGTTVLLKPNLLTTRIGGGTLAQEDLSPTVNGVTTDWRVTLVVAELVRAQSPARVIVLEGSTDDTEDAFQILGYTKENFGTLIDEFIPLEGADCSNRSTDGLRQARGHSGTQYWASEEFLDADVVISLPVLKTHAQAGITGAVKNIGIGMVPVSQYPGTSGNCTRSFSYPNHSNREELNSWIADFYSLHPAHFSVLDGLQGVQHGPLPAWGGGDYDEDRMNMRLIMASRDTVALDVVAAEVMGCDPSAIGYLSQLADWGLGTADPEDITVLGVPVSEVVTHFEGPSWACPPQ